MSEHYHPQTLNDSNIFHLCLFLWYSSSKSWIRPSLLISVLSVIWLLSIFTCIVAELQICFSSVLYLESTLALFKICRIVQVSTESNPKWRVMFYSVAFSIMCRKNCRCWLPYPKIPGYLKKTLSRLPMATIVYKTGAICQNYHLRVELDEFYKDGVFLS